MTLHMQFIKAVKNYSSRRAVYDTITGKDISYEHLFIGCILLKKFISKCHGRYIGVMLPPGAGSILSILATLMDGKIPVMINYSTGARENAAYAQQKCHFKTIVTSKKMLEKMHIEPIDGMIFIEDWLTKIKPAHKLKAMLATKLTQTPLGARISKGNEDDVAVILFTSGSEKEPKAVQLSHKNITHNLIGIRELLDFSAKDVFIANLPYFHVFGLTVNLWLPLTMGASIITIPNPLDYQMVCNSVKKFGVTIMVGTPTFFWGYLKKADKDTFKSLRVAIAGADKLPEKIRDAYLHKHNLVIHEGYGTTETSPVISTNSPQEHRPGSVGKPLKGVQVRITDIDTGNELPIGEEGKILVKGDLVMKGYFDDIEETSLRIEDGWYDTGDMGVLDEEGFLWHRGRLKRFVKIGGEMVSLVKVETYLEEIMPEGEVCCVVDVPNLEKGADIVACVSTTKIDKKVMTKHLRGKLPPIAIPKEFSVIEDIPMMASGKVNFREVESIVKEHREKAR